MKIKEIKEGQCPICGSTDLECTNTELKDLLELKREFFCNSCEFVFEDLYELKFFAQKDSNTKTYLKVGQEVDWDD